MENLRKQKIAEDLQNYVDRRAKGSMNQAAKQLLKVSVATVSNILGNKWDNIADAMWHSIEKQVGNNYEGEWIVVRDIRNYQILETLFDDARSYASVYGIIGDPGYGKTCTSRDDGNKPNSFLIECNGSDDRRRFLSKLLRQMGKLDTSYRLGDMLDAAVSHLRTLDRPLLKLDEVDKLSDNVLFFFISLYNQLEGKCGLVLTGTPYLKKRIEYGAMRNKMGYKEIKSRIGGRFVELDPPSDDDVTRIIQANGITDPLVIQKIINESEQDLRRVKRRVHAEKRKEAEYAR